MELNSNKIEPGDFEQVVADSKAKIHEDMAKKEPRKRGPYKKRERSQGSQDSSPVQNQAPPVGTVPQAPPSMAGQLKLPIQAISKLPAMKYQISELAFNEDEALMCAQAVDEIVKAWIPDVNSMSPKTAATLGGILVFGSIGFNKFMIYQSVMNERQKMNLNSEKTEKTENSEIQNQGPVVMASDMFKGKV